MLLSYILSHNFCLLFGVRLDMYVLERLPRRIDSNAAEALLIP
jgi:hypothetical protein